jgi:hypothetical protein
VYEIVVTLSDTKHFITINDKIRLTVQIDEAFKCKNEKIEALMPQITLNVVIGDMQEGRLTVQQLKDQFKSSDSEACPLTGLELLDETMNLFTDEFPIVWDEANGLTVRNEKTMPSRTFELTVRARIELDVSTTMPLKVVIKSPDQN